MLLVDLNWDTFAIVPDRDQVAIRVNLNLYHGHAWVPLEIVGRIDKYLIYKQVDQLLVSAKIEFTTINGSFLSLRETYRRFCRGLERTGSV